MVILLTWIRTGSDKINPDPLTGLLDPTLVICISFVRIWQNEYNYTNINQAKNVETTFNGKFKLMF